ARAAFADDHRHDRDPEAQAAIGRPRDGFRLTALLSADARIGAGRVDEGQDGQAEAVGGFQEAHRLAVTLGSRHAPIVREIGRRIAASFLAYHHHRLALQPAESTDYGLVL